MNKVDDWKNFIALEEIIIHSFFNFIEHSKNEDEKNLVKIAFRKIIDISNSILKKQDKSFFSPNTNYSDIINRHFYSDTGSESIINYNKELKTESNLRLRLKCIKYLIKLNKTRLLKFNQRKIFIIIEGFNPSVLSKLSTYGLIIPISSKLLIRKLKRQNLESDFIKRIASHIGILIYKDLIKKFPKIKIDYTEIIELINSHISEFYEDYLLLSKTRLPQRIALGTHNKSFLRVYSAAVVRNGGEVISCAHGHNLQNRDAHKLWMDIILSTRYFEYNKELAEELKDYIKSIQYNNIQNCHIEAMLENSLIHANLDHEKNIGKIKSVLLIGNAAKLNGHSSVTSYLPKVQFDIELTILKYFHKMNKNTFYKLHPEGKLKSNTIQLYNNFDFIKIEEEAFEKIVDKYDLVVFYYTKTTTINAALRSNKQVLIVDLGTEKLCTESANLINRRCSMLKFSDLCAEL